MNQFPVMLFGKEIGKAGTHMIAFRMVKDALPEDKKRLLDDVYLDCAKTGFTWQAYASAREFYDLRGEIST